MTDILKELDANAKTPAFAGRTKAEIPEYEVKNKLFKNNLSRCETLSQVIELIKQNNITPWLFYRISGLEMSGIAESNDINDMARIYAEIEGFDLEGKEVA
ncbi:MAG: hypothetical protein IJ576_08715 [Synergistaceae bacterium]|nr:hypothetical protein [Synergistaceae bacterium]MBR1602010.1 hypothetical protein [Synergistaceae bacterium]